VPRKKKKNQQKTFFKVREKLVLVPPRKFFGKKILGVFFLVIGSLTLSLTLLYFYVLPRIFPKADKAVEVEQQQEFVPQRLLLPGAGLDFSIEKEALSGKFPLSQGNIQKDAEILILGEKQYYRYRVEEVGVADSTDSARLFIEDSKLKMQVPLSSQKNKLLLIRAFLD